MLVMQNQCRLGTDHDLSTLNGSQAGFVDDAVAAHLRIGAFGNADGLLLLGSVQHHDDVAPVVTSRIVLQPEGHYLTRSFQEFQMLAYQVCRAQTEGRMVAGSASPDD